MTCGVMAMKEQDWLADTRHSPIHSSLLKTPRTATGSIEITPDRVVSHRDSLFVGKVASQQSKY